MAANTDFKPNRTIPPGTERRKTVANLIAGAFARSIVLATFSFPPPQYMMQLCQLLGLLFLRDRAAFVQRQVVAACTTCWRRCAAGSRNALLQVGKERRLHNRAIETYENWLSLGDNPLGARTEGAHRVASRCLLFKFWRRAELSEKTGFEGSSLRPDP